MSQHLWATTGHRYGDSLEENGKNGVMLQLWSREEFHSICVYPGRGVTDREGHHLLKRYMEKGWRPLDAEQTKRALDYVAQKIEDEKAALAFAEALTA